MFPSSSSLQIKEYSVIIFSFLHHSETFITNMITITYQLYQCHAEVFPILLSVVQKTFIWSLLLALIFIVLGKSPSSAPFVTPLLTFSSSHHLQICSRAKSKHRSLQSSTGILPPLQKLFTPTVLYLLATQCPSCPCEILFLSPCLLSFIWGCCKEFQQRFLENSNRLYKQDDLLTWQINFVVGKARLLHKSHADFSKALQLYPCGC